MEMNKDVVILAIESSCDETAAAVVKNGREVLSNVIIILTPLASKRIVIHATHINSNNEDVPRI